MIRHILPHPKQRTSWLAMLLALALVCQALLPTFAYARSDLNPRFWDEICSVYGNKQNQPGKPVAIHHADCPLCLNVVDHLIPVASCAAPQLRLLLLAEISHFIATTTLFAHGITAPVARGPPLSI